MNAMLDNDYKLYYNSILKWIRNDIEIPCASLFTYLRILAAAGKVSSEMSIELCKRINSIDDLATWAFHLVLIPYIDLSLIPQEEDFIYSRIIDNWTTLDLLSEFESPLYCPNTLLLYIKSSHKRYN